MHHRKENFVRVKVNLDEWISPLISGALAFQKPFSKRSYSSHINRNFVSEFLLRHDWE